MIKELRFFVFIIIGFFLLSFSITYSQTGRVTVTVTTVSYSGEFKPENCGAVWITNSSDTFVKTLKVWATDRKKCLIKWQGYSQGNVIDAISGATLKKHQSHTVSWNLTDLHKKEVPNGLYKIYLECTEDNSNEKNRPPGRCIVLEFTKDSTDEQYQIDYNNYFQSIKLTYTAPGTSVEVAAGKNNLAYNSPNPFTGETTIYFSCTAKGIVTVKIFDTFGRCVKQLDEPYCDSGNGSIGFVARDLPAGFYYYIVQVGNQLIKNKMILLDH